jgi:hypothetical protein
LQLLLSLLLLLLMFCIFLSLFYSKVELTSFFNQDNLWCVWNFVVRLTILPHTCTFV